MPNQKKRGPYRMAKMTAIGGVLLLLSYLGSLIFPLGSGSRLDNEDSADSTPASDTRNGQDQVGTSPTDTTHLHTSLPTDGTAIADPARVRDLEEPAPEVLEIRIDERSYFLEDQTQQSSLDAVVAAAGRTTGDANGIRVRILRYDTSRASAEQQLKDALARAGIGPDAIYMPATFLTR